MGDWRSFGWGRGYHPWHKEEYTNDKLREKEHIHTILPGDYRPRELFYSRRDVFAFIVGLAAAILVVIIIYFGVKTL